MVVQSEDLDVSAFTDPETLVQTLKLLEHSTALVGIYDAEDRLRYANDAFRQAWWIEKGEHPTWTEIMRRNYNLQRGTIIKADNLENWLQSTKARRGKNSKRAFETDLHDGRWIWMTETTLENGWMICIAGDVTCIRKDERSLRQDRDMALIASQTDELTGLPSRRFAFSRLKSILETKPVGSLPQCCLAVLDIDHFKRINDIHGHLTGDLVLKTFAALTQPLIRKVDLLGRVGGEEFILIMPAIKFDEAKTMVEALLDECRRACILEKHPRLQFTCSAGLASSRENEPHESLFRRADLALYEAKQAGRDRLVCSN